MLETYRLKLQIRSALSRSHPQRRFCCTGTLEVPCALGDWRVAQLTIRSAEKIEVSEKNNRVFSCKNAKCRSNNDAYDIKRNGNNARHGTSLTMMDSSPMTTGPLKVFLARNILLIFLKDVVLLCGFGKIMIQFVWNEEALLSWIAAREVFHPQQYRSRAIHLILPNTLDSVSLRVRM